jgi:NTP pyrophosphatase (non-canonical NTP hydrolase)
MSTNFIEPTMRFATRMLLKLDLPRNREKDHWDTLSIASLRGRLLDEVTELEDALDSVDTLDPRATSRDSAGRIANECVDVANFAMMIADRVGGLR